MKSSTELHRELASARHACFVVGKNFGNYPFQVEPKLKPALSAAEKRGWAKWVGPNLCVLTPDGLREATTYTGARR